jgi:hypothetical protein
MNVTLHIEKLILDGLDVRPGDRQHLQAAVEAELTRLLGEGGIAAGLAEGGAVPAVRGGSIQTGGGGGAAGLGSQIAQAVYGGIGK